MNTTKKDDMKNQADQAFIQILEDNKERIYRICRIYAVSPLQPQDLFQEVVFEIWKSFSTFEGKSNISTWIYRIALNVCYRSKLRLKKRNDKTVRLDAIQFVPAETGPDEDQEEKYAALRECISSLNEAERSLVVLYLDELPYKDIAAITGLTENHVAVKMKRIKKRLFDCITHKLR